MIKPLIINFHGTDLKPESRILVFFEKILKRSMKNTKMIVVPSEFLKKEVAEKFGVSFERIFVSPSGGVNFDIFKSFDDNPSSVKEFSAGFISRIEKDKGWDVFVQALDELKKRNILHDRKFLIVGTGSQKKELITMVEQFGLEKNIKYCESTDQKDLPKYFNSIDVFVFPSKRESLGLVGLESMACGTPVIGSKIGGISDYLRDSENGMFFSAGDYIDLAEKIEKFMRLTKIEKMRLKENALNTAKDYDRDRIVSIFYNKLKSIVEIRG